MGMEMMVGSGPRLGGLYFSTLMSRRRMSWRSRGQLNTLVFCSHVGTCHWIRGTHVDIRLEITSVTTVTYQWSDLY